MGCAKDVQLDEKLRSIESTMVNSLSIITVAQMQSLEQAAIVSGQVTGLELMERAGQGVVDEMFAFWPELAPLADDFTHLENSQAPVAVIVCGPGNNGGDGFVVARLLFRLGWRVHVSLFGDPDRLPRDARTNYEAWSKLGETAVLMDFEDEHAWRDVALGPSSAHVFIDALFGIGLRRPLGGILKAVTGRQTGKARNASRRVVSIDVPSGLDADTGDILGHHAGDEALQEMLNSGQSVSGLRAFKPDLTVTFHAPKPGHLQGMGPWLCGTLKVVDIGL